MSYNMDKALNLIKNKNGDEALLYLAKAMENNEEESYSVSALLYLDGELVEKDNDKAIELLNKGLENDDNKSISILGDIYYKGEIVDKDTEKAKNLYLKALSLGDTHSIGMLGLIYYFEKDYAKAVEYFKDGMSLNDINSIYYLGECALNGYGMDIDLKLAFLSFESCYKQLSNRMIFIDALANMYFNGYGIEVNYQKSYELYDKTDSDISKYRRALMLKEGLGVEKNLEKAYELFKSTKTKEAQTEAGLMEYLGLGTDENKESAYFKFYAAASLNYKESYMLLGDCYLNGHGIKKDIFEAIKWYTKAANENIPNSYLNIGHAYLLLKKKDKALDAFLKEYDSVYKFSSLGQTYYNKKMYDEAIIYLEKASNLDDIKATYLLYKIYSKKYKKERNKEKANMYYMKYLLLVNKEE